jgi:hypothetical protein
MNEISEAALRREEESKTKFSQAVKNFDKTALEPHSTTHVIQLLQPLDHLVAKTYTSFRKFVASHAGWKVKRRVATDKERKEHHVTRNGKAYFIDVVYKVPSPKKSTPPVADDAKMQAAKTTPPVADNAKIPAAKKSTPPVADGAKMPTVKKQKLADVTNA